MEAMAMTWCSCGLRYIASATFVALVLAAAPAVAQDRLSIGAWEVVSTGPDFGTTVGPAGALAGELADGGRYGLLRDRLIDRLTGAEAEFGNARLLQTVATDPARPRAFFTRHPALFVPADAVVMADLQTGAMTTLLILPGLAGWFVTAHFAVDAERLVVSYRDATDPTGVSVEWVVVDLASGTPVARTVTLPSIAGASWAISPDGAYLYRAAFDTSANTAAVVSHDLATGALTGRAAMPYALSPRIQWSDALDAVVIGSREAVNVAVTFTAFNRALQAIGGAVVPSLFMCDTQVVISPTTGRIYAYTGGGIYRGVQLSSRLMGARLGTPGPVDSVDVAAAVKADCGDLHVASPPGAPRRVRATVTDGTVAFAWENVGAASRFTMDVGVAPGRTDLSLPLGPDSQRTVTGVPPGTYYVRIRGTNTFGRGEPSNEIEVVVR